MKRLECFGGPKLQTWVGLLVLSQGTQKSWLLETASLPPPLSGSIWLPWFARPSVLYRTQLPLPMHWSVPIVQQQPRQETLERVFDAVTAFAHADKCVSRLL